MILVPSISIHKGKITRLAQGDYALGTTYEQDPIELARQFESAGATMLHLVDLDGAKKGSPVNDFLLETIASRTKMKINFAGGVHTDGDISKVFECGASSVTCATMSVYEPDLFTSWIMSYGREKLVLGADALDGQIRVGGWQNKTEIDILDHIGYFHHRGLKYVKTSDIAKHGSMEGPSFDLYEKILAKYPDISLFAGGGIRNLSDIRKFKEIGVSGVIFGKAFYEGRLTLEDISAFHAEE